MSSECASAVTGRERLFTGTHKTSRLSKLTDATQYCKQKQASVSCYLTTQKKMDDGNEFCGWASAVFADALLEISDVTEQMFIRLLYFGA